MNAWNGHNIIAKMFPLLFCSLRTEILHKHPEILWLIRQYSQEEKEKGENGKMADKESLSQEKVSRTNLENMRWDERDLQKFDQSI